MIVCQHSLVRCALFGGVHPTQSERLGDGGADGSFALQNPVEKAALDAVTLGKSVLASCPLNCCPEQPDNIIIFKHKWGAAHFACAPGTSRFRLFTFCQCKRPRRGFSQSGRHRSMWQNFTAPGRFKPRTPLCGSSYRFFTPRAADFTGTARDLIFPDQCRLPKRFFLAGVRSLSARGNACVGGV